jgi:hypothetical protein
VEKQERTFKGRGLGNIQIKVFNSFRKVIISGHEVHTPLPDRIQFLLLAPNLFRFSTLMVPPSRRILCILDPDRVLDHAVLSERPREDADRVAPLGQMPCDRVPQSSRGSKHKHPVAH